MVEARPRAQGRVAPCLRSTVTFVAVLSRIPRLSSIARRAPARSSRCPIKRPVPARPRSSMSTRQCWAGPRKTRPPRGEAFRRRTLGGKPENEHGAPVGAPFRFRCRGWLQLHDVLRRRALLGLHDLELHALAFGQRLESFSLNRGVVHEAVLAAVLGRDEPEALGVIEPLHGTGDACHLFVAPSLYVSDGEQLCSYAAVERRDSHRSVFASCPETGLPS